MWFIIWGLLTVGNFFLAREALKLDLENGKKMEGLGLIFFTFFIMLIPVFGTVATVIGYFLTVSEHKDNADIVRKVFFIKEKGQGN